MSKHGHSSSVSAVKNHLRFCCCCC
jgi:hypothetical protein